MAYDSGRGVTVLFGGWDGKEVFGQTWEYDGVSPWTWRPNPNDPLGRYGHAMAYDPLRRVTVLCGGVDSKVNLLPDTWEWDGAAWVRRQERGPLGEFGGHRLVYYEPLEAIMLFGGVIDGRGLQNSVWLWDGTQWSELDAGPIRPRTRTIPAMAYDSRRQRVVVFGGERTGGEPLGDTWEFGLYLDCDQSTGAGYLDIFDFLCFQNKYVANDLYACDCDTGTGLGLCDIFDFLCFQNLFEDCAR